MKVRRIQSSFNSGVLDPRLKARIDTKAYYHGAQTLKNAVCLPYGGVAKRYGTTYLGTVPAVCNRISSVTATAPNGGTAANANDDDTTSEVHTTGNIGTTDPYVVVHYDLGSAKTVRYADVVGLRLTTDSSDEFYIQYSTDNSTWLSVNGALGVSSTDLTQRKTGPYTAQYWRVARIGSTDLGTNKARIDEFHLWEDSSTLSDSRIIPFSFNTEQDYALLATDGNIRVFKDDVFLTDIRVPALTSAMMDKLDYTQSADTLLLVHPDLEPLQIVRDSTSEGLWTANTMTLSNVPQYDFGSGNEDVWSSSRGWPLTVTFYEGRCIFGGSKSRPQSIWTTQSNDFYNFDLGTSQPDEAIHSTLDTDQVNEIRHLSPGRKLEILTSGGEFVVPESPMTPEGFSVRRQTKYGASKVRYVSIDGSNIFVQRNGRGLREMLFSFTEDAYVANSVSQLSNHLVSAPVDMAASPGTENEETNYVYVVNGDGEIIVFNTLREQEIAAWSGPWTTDGSFKRVGVVDTSVYFVVEREIDGVVVNYFEKYARDVYTDCSLVVTGNGSATVTGASHLEGETVRIVADGAVMNDGVISSGSTTLSRSADDVKLGMDYTPEIKTMPVNDDFQDGPTLNRMKRIVRVLVNCYQTQGLLVEGEKTPDRNFGTGVFDSVPTPDNDLREVYLLGWTDDASVTLTQVDPVPMTIIGIDMEVSV